MYIPVAQVNESKSVRFIPFSGMKYEAAINDKIGLYEKSGGDCWSPDPIMFAYVPKEIDFDGPSEIVLNPELFDVKYLVCDQEVERNRLSAINHALCLAEQNAQIEMGWACGHGGYKEDLLAEERIFNAVEVGGIWQDVVVRVIAKVK